MIDRIQIKKSNLKIHSQEITVQRSTVQHKNRAKKTRTLGLSLGLGLKFRLKLRLSPNLRLRLKFRLRLAPRVPPDLGLPPECLQRLGLPPEPHSHGVTLGARCPQDDPIDY